MSVLEEAKRLNKTSKNPYRLDCLYSIRGDFLSWLFFDEKEEKLAYDIVKKIEAYIKYLERKDK